MHYDNFDDDDKYDDDDDNYDDDDVQRVSGWKLGWEGLEIWSSQALECLPSALLILIMMMMLMILKMMMMMMTMVIMMMMIMIMTMRSN